MAATRGPIDFSDHSGAHAAIPDGEDRKPLTILLLFTSVVGFFLALGNQGPTGALFLWAYDHVPFFAVMREPQKFLMLLAMAYAVFFGWGVERFSQIDVSPKRVGTIAAASLIGVILPLSYAPTMFDGLAGQMTVTPLPDAYAQANAVMGTAQGTSCTYHGTSIWRIRLPAGASSPTSRRRHSLET